MAERYISFSCLFCVIKHIDAMPAIECTPRCLSVCLTGTGTGGTDYPVSDRPQSMFPLNLMNITLLLSNCVLCL